ncbi:hypothetical protein EV363DRAFT_1156398 [Boletus edulis]|uniref:Uncharacterized protein n=1 Tax=Boletus edulis BED1 TaxID=1328754 RepID=A0AAD4BAH8_BOLED|nr:hypothetical protein EV363DRAFT_1156398 [Boletus edulis]KAF8414779.1 hypothetical protein L210DRAFT_854013 [Boletus edulis BED1]
MTRFALVVAAIAKLLSFSAGVYSTSCLACPNCDLNGCLNYWTLEDTAYHLLATNPGAYDGCVFTGELTSYRYYTGGPAACDSLYIGDNSKCVPYNNSWHVPGNECTSSYVISICRGIVTRAEHTLYSPGPCVLTCFTTIRF